MAQEPRQESYLSLGLKETSIPLNDVCISPTNKSEPKTIYLLGSRITAMPLADSPISPEKKTSGIELLDQRILGFYEKEMFLFSASPMKTDQNSKTHCSFNAESSENPNEDISLASKATSMPLTDVSLSPKKNDSQAIYLFGTRIPAPPQESYSLASTATSMALADVTISPTKKRSRTSMMQEPRTTLQDRFCLGSNSKDMSLLSASPVETDENSKTHCLSNAESSENPKEGLKEDARKIKKMRYLSKKEKQTEVSMELDLNVPPCTIAKTLTPSDVNSLTRLMMETCPAESHILRYLSEAEQRTIQEGNKVKVKVYDHDTDTEHNMVFQRWKTSKSYLFNGGWGKEFIRRRDLKGGDKIGLCWNSFDYRFHFCVLSRAPANQ